MNIHQFVEKRKEKLLAEKMKKGLIRKS